jgi:hypothetical protein
MWPQAGRPGEIHQRFSVAPNATDYPTLDDREQLVTALVNHPWAKTRTAPVGAVVPKYSILAGHNQAKPG